MGDAATSADVKQIPPSAAVIESLNSLLLILSSMDADTPEESDEISYDTLNVYLRLLSSHWKSFESLFANLLSRVAIT